MSAGLRHNTIFIPIHVIFVITYAPAQGLVLEKFDMALFNLLRAARQDAGQVMKRQQLCHDPNSNVPRAEPSMPMDDMLRVLSGIAFGLTGLHGRGLLHCDLKSANVLVQVRPAFPWLSPCCSIQANWLSSHLFSMRYHRAPAAPIVC